MSKKEPFGNIDPSVFRVDASHPEDPYSSQPISTFIWGEKYRWKHNPNRNELEPWDSIERVVSGAYANDAPVNNIVALHAMRAGVWLPAGRIQAGAGTSKIVTLMNCYVDRDIEDSMSGIADALKDAMLTMQQGGGIGMNFSTLRPSGAWLQRTGAIASGPLPFMDMWDAMCATIMSAGDRRGAMMGTMAVDHPDIIDFIHAKRKAGRLTNFNVSVLVSDAFMQAVSEDEEWSLGFGVPRHDGAHAGTVQLPGGKTWYIYRTIRARELWEMILQNTYEYSEPGVIFIDRVNDWNNLKYAETISCTNPCVTGDTLILTDRGHIPIRDLVGKEVNIWNGEEWSSVIPFSTGVNDLMEITFSNGHTVCATPYHRWVLWDGSTVESNTLKVGDKLIHAAMPIILEGDQYSTDAYSQGLYCGDGTRNSEASNLYKHCDAILNRITGKLYNTNCTTQPGYRWHHGKMLPKDFVPVNGNVQYCTEWLAGYLDADGSLIRKGDTYVVEASAKDRNFLRKIGLMLNRLGVNYRIWERVDAGLKSGSNGKTYLCESTASLMVSHTGMHQLYALGLRCSRLNTSVFQNIPQGVARVGHRVVAVKHLGIKAETFCFNEPKRNMGVFNGVIGHNCGEQPLPPNGACNLGAVNLARMVHNPFTRDARFNWEMLHAAAFVGVRFLDNVIDVTHYPLKAQEEVERGNRRIGIGITGLANALMMLNMRYGSEEALAFTNKIMDRLKNTVYLASAMLAKERGTFPLYDRDRWGQTPVVDSLDEEVKEMIDRYGIRNGVLLTIAPTGTTSLYCGNISSGLEPVFAYKMKRKIRRPDGEYDTHMVKDYAIKMFEDIYGENTPYPPHFVTAADLTVTDHLRVQSTCQRHVDASISKTINCPEDMSYEDFKLVYRDAYELQCKGCTTYRPSAVRGSILESADGVPLSDGASKASGASSNPGELKVQTLPPRPKVLAGKTYKIKWPSAPSAHYVTINDDENGHPFEIFITSTIATHQDWATALSLMISAIFRKGDDVKFVGEELMKIISATDSAWVEGKYWGSLVALIGHTIDTHISHRLEVDQTLHVTIQELQATALKIPEEDRKGEIQQIRGATCPKCLAPTLLFKEGCKECVNCGYSSCA